MSDSAIERSSRNGEFQAGLSEARQESVHRVSPAAQPMEWISRKAAISKVLKFLQGDLSRPMAEVMSWAVSRRSILRPEP